MRLMEMEIKLKYNQVWMEAVLAWHRVASKVPLQKKHGGSLALTSFAVHHAACSRPSAGEIHCFSMLTDGNTLYRYQLGQWPTEDTVHPGQKPYSES